MKYIVTLSAAEYHFVSEHFGNAQKKLEDLQEKGGGKDHAPAAITAQLDKVEAILDSLDDATEQTVAVDFAI